MSCHRRAADGAATSAGAPSAGESDDLGRNGGAGDGGSSDGGRAAVAAMEVDLAVAARGTSAAGGSVHAVQMGGADGAADGAATSAGAPSAGESDDLGGDGGAGDGGGNGGGAAVAALVGGERDAGNVSHWSTALLPSGWQELYDETYCTNYYYHPGPPARSTWTRPSGGDAADAAVFGGASGASNDTAAAPAASVPPLLLPVGWQVFIDPSSGQSVYVETATGLSSWVRPSADAQRDKSQHALSALWTPHNDDAGNTYYQNQMTGEVSWTIPSAAGGLSTERDVAAGGGGAGAGRRDGADATAVLNLPNGSVDPAESDGQAQAKSDIWGARGALGAAQMGEGDDGAAGEDDQDVADEGLVADSVVRVYLSRLGHANHRVADEPNTGIPHDLKDFVAKLLGFAPDMAPAQVELGAYNAVRDPKTPAATKTAVQWLRDPAATAPELRRRQKAFTEHVKRTKRAELAKKAMVLVTAISQLIGEKTISKDALDMETCFLPLIGSGGRPVEGEGIIVGAGTDDDPFMFLMSSKGLLLNLANVKSSGPSLETIDFTYKACYEAFPMVVISMCDSQHRGIPLGIGVASHEKNEFVAYAKRSVKVCDTCSSKMMYMCFNRFLHHACTVLGSAVCHLGFGEGGRRRVCRSFAACCTACYDRDSDGCDCTRASSHKLGCGPL